jgi:hypothetical protein
VGRGAAASAIARIGAIAVIGADRGDRGARPAFGERRERRGFDTRDGPRTFGGPDDRSVGERTEQRGEWAERAERLRGRAAAPRRGRRRPGRRPGDGGAADITES